MVLEQTLARRLDASLDRLEVVKLLGAAMCMPVPRMICNPVLAAVRVPVFGAAMRMAAGRLPAVLRMIRNLVIAVPAVLLAINNYMLVVVLTMLAAVLGRGLVRTMFGHVDVHGDAARGASAGSEKTGATVKNLSSQKITKVDFWVPR
jgi:hypothetical protein